MKKNIVQINIKIVQMRKNSSNEKKKFQNKKHSSNEQKK